MKPDWIFVSLVYFDPPEIYIQSLVDNVIKLGNNLFRVTNGKIGFYRIKVDEQRYVLEFGILCINGFLLVDLGVAEI